MSVEKRNDKNGHAVTIREGIQRAAPTFEQRYEVFDDTPLLRFADSTLFAGFDSEQEVSVTIERINQDVHSADLVSRNAGKARFLRSITHQNVVRANDFSQEHGTLVLDHLKGCIRDEKPRAADALNILRAVLQGINEIHKRGKLHGNLTAECIVRGADGIVKIANSQAYTVDDPELRLTRGCLVAPEMVDPDRGSIGPGSDLFCVGLAVLEAVVGRDVTKLYCGDQRRWAVSVQAFPAKLLKKLPKAMQPVFTRLVAKDLAERFASVAEVLDAIEELETKSNSQSSHTKATVKTWTSPFSDSSRNVDNSNLFDRLADWEWLKSQARRPTTIVGSVCILAAFLLLASSGASAPIASGKTKVLIQARISDEARPRVHVDSRSSSLNPEWETVSNDLLQASLELPEGRQVIYLSTRDGRITGRQEVFLVNGQILDEPGADPRPYLSFVFQSRRAELRVEATSKDKTRDGSPLVQLYRVGDDLKDKELAASGLGSLVFEEELDGTVQQFRVRASMILHEDFVSEPFTFRPSDEPLELKFTLRPLVDMTFMADRDSSPAYIKIDGKNVVGVATDSGVEFRALVPQSPTVQISAMKPGFEPLERTIDTMRKSRMQQFLSLTKSTSPPIPKGNLYTITTFDESSNKEIAGLKMRLDGRPVTGEGGHSSTPLQLYVLPGFHVVEFVEPVTNEVVYRYRSLFQDNLLRPYPIQTVSVD